MTTMASQITSLTLFIETFIQTQIKENIKVPRPWPLCGEFTGTDEFPAQRASYAENVSIWWRHHGFFEAMIKWSILEHEVTLLHLLWWPSCVTLVKLQRRWSLTPGLPREYDLWRTTKKTTNSKVLTLLIIYRFVPLKVHMQLFFNRKLLFKLHRHCQNIYCLSSRYYGSIFNAGRSYWLCKVKKLTQLPLKWPDKTRYATEKTFQATPLLVNQDDLQVAET